MTWELCRRLVKRGWRVEWFSSRYPGSPESNVLEDVRFVRGGTQMTVFAAAFRRYRVRDDFDVVIDEINTIPFYASLYVTKPTIAYINQLAREVWLYEGPPVLKYLGYLLEPLYLVPYHRSDVFTISKSSRETLRGFGLRGRIEIVPIGVDDPAIPTIEDRAWGDIVVMGRVTPSKRIEHSIRAASLLRSGHGWSGSLVIMGSGTAAYTERLRMMAQRNGVPISFVGHVSEEKRKQTLRASSIMFMTSVREGWGLAITEAARAGLPAVVYDVPGLRDAVQDGVTGRVVAPDSDRLAASAVQIWNDYRAFATRARDVSVQYTWDRSAETLDRILDDCRERGLKNTRTTSSTSA